MAKSLLESSLDFNPFNQVISARPPEVISNKNPRFRLRACNSENYNDIASVLELFQAHYGKSHPLPKALTDTFWKKPEYALSGEEFLSLIVEDLDTKKTVAHIALAFRNEDQHVEILLPAIDPAYRNSLSSLFNIFSTKISDIIVRKKWERLLFLCSTSDPLLQIIAHSYLSAKAIAFLNSGISCAATSHLESKVVKIKEQIKCPYILLSSSIASSKILEPIYVPKSLKRFVNKRAKLMRITFSYGEENVESHLHLVSSERQTDTASPIKRHLQFTNRGLYGIGIVDCYPSKTNSVNHLLIKAIGRLQSKSKTSLSLRVCLNTPTSPYFIQSLKIFGFIPSGIDIKEKRIFLILSELAPDSMYGATLFSSEAKTLREDILRRRWAE